MVATSRRRTTPGARGDGRAVSGLAAAPPLARSDVAGMFGESAADVSAELPTSSPKLRPVPPIAAPPVVPPPVELAAPPVVPPPPVCAPPSVETPVGGAKPGALLDCVGLLPDEVLEVVGILLALPDVVIGVPPLLEPGGAPKSGMPNPPRGAATRAGICGGR